MTKAIDLFAGAGGFTAGAELAGVDVIYAANHWQPAVDAHAANFPNTVHECQDLCQADFSLLPDFDMLLASPACQGHSNARGAEAKNHDALRATAWAIVACLDTNNPETIVIENVPEMRNWCRRDKNGKPIEPLGTRYNVWLKVLESCGYHLTENILDAADFGVPQNRSRLFIVGSRSRSITIETPGLAHVPASSFIDFDGGNWFPVNKRGRAQATLDRVAAGRAQYGARFLAPYYGSGSGRIGRDLARPIGTISTVDGWSVVDGDRMRMLTVAEYAQAMGFPADYELARTKRESCKLLGNAVCPPVAAAVVAQVAAAA